MNYGVEERKMMCEEGVRPIVPHEPLGNIMEKAVAMGNDAFILARRINQHMFGDCGSEQKPEREPRCFAEAMKYHAETLAMLVEELHRFAGMMGI